MILPKEDMPLESHVGRDLDLTYIKTGLEIQVREFAELRARLRKAIWTVTVWLVVNSILTAALATLTWVTRVR